MFMEECLSNKLIFSYNVINVFKHPSTKNNVNNRHNVNPLQTNQLKTISNKEDGEGGRGGG